MDKFKNQELEAKKVKLVSRLANYGIKDTQVSYLQYLSHSNEKFQSAYDAGCRMMILYAVSFPFQNLEERQYIVNWFKGENIWDKVSSDEKKFLANPKPDEKTILDYYGRFESALTLGWCLKKVKSLPMLDIHDLNDNQKVNDEFELNIPKLGEPLMLFLTSLEFREFDEIYEENLVNELVTTYFRNLLFSGENDETEINRFTSFERHKVLNWLRTAPDDGSETTGELWDDTDTST